MTTFFHCHPEGNARRIPRLSAIYIYHYCGWDSSPAYPAYRQAGGRQAAGKANAQNDNKKVLGMTIF